MRWWIRVGLAVVLSLALLETRLFLSEEESRGLVALVLAAGAVGGLLLSRWIPLQATLPAAGVGLVLPYPLVLAALAATALGGTAFEWLFHPVSFVLLATPVAVAALTGSRLADGLASRRWLAGAGGAVVAAGLALVVAAPGAAWLEEPPPAQFPRIDDAIGAYGPVALGDSRAELFASFGSRPRAGRDESLTPTGADAFEGPTSIPMGSPDFYRYEDVVFWFEHGRVKGFEVTSPGARTSRGIAVGSDLNDVRAAYPELECGVAPAGDTGRLAPERWVWFGGDPVSTITYSSGGFE